MQLEERIKAEQEWHNKSVYNDARSKVHKYYTTTIKVSAIFKKTIEQYCNPDSTVLLDYGCGDGSDLLPFSNKIKEGVGIDISDNLIDNARRASEKKGC